MSSPVNPLSTAIHEGLLQLLVPLAKKIEEHQQLFLQYASEPDENARMEKWNAAAEVSNGILDTIKQLRTKGSFPDSLNSLLPVVIDGLASSLNAFMQGYMSANALLVPRMNLIKPPTFNVLKTW